MSDPTFCASWIDFSPTNFQANTEIWITLDRTEGNPTHRIYVRLHPENASYNADKIGIANIDVNSDVVKIKLSRSYSNITQISVHGGLNPFGAHPMPSNKGTECPIIVSAETH